MHRVSVAAFAVLLLCGCALYVYKQSPYDPVKATCARSGKGEGNYKMLVVGDSWAAGSLFFPELPQSMSAKMAGKPVTACSIGYSGRNTARLVQEPKADFPIGKIKALFSGASPNEIVIMNGVNDVIQHVGAEQYAKATSELVTYLNEESRVRVLRIPRVNETGYSSNLLRDIKRKLQAFYFDDGQLAVNDKYRAALANSYPAIETIEYDRFAPGYRKELFLPDGIHLTDQQFRFYGAFIATKIPAP